MTMYCGGRLGQEYSIEDVGEKAETYLEFFLSGQLLESFPAAKGRRAIIRVSCEFTPHSQFKEKFRKMANQLAGYDVGLLVDVSSMHSRGGVFDYST